MGPLFGLVGGGGGGGAGGGGGGGISRARNTAILPWSLTDLAHDYSTFRLICV